MISGAIAGGFWGLLDFVAVQCVCTAFCICAVLVVCLVVPWGLLRRMQRQTPGPLPSVPTRDRMLGPKRDYFAVALFESLEMLANDKELPFWTHWCEEEHEGRTVYEILLERAIGDEGPHSSAVLDNILAVACTNAHRGNALECLYAFLDYDTPALHAAWRFRDIPGCDPGVWPLQVACERLAVHMFTIDPCMRLISTAAAVLPADVMWGRTQGGGSVLHDFSRFRPVVGLFMYLVSVTPASVLAYKDATGNSAFHCSPYMGGGTPSTRRRRPHYRNLTRYSTNEIDAMREAAFWFARNAPDDLFLSRGAEGMTMFHRACWAGDWELAGCMAGRMDRSHMLMRDDHGLSARDHAVITASGSSDTSDHHKRQAMASVNALFDPPVKNAAYR